MKALSWWLIIQNRNFQGKEEVRVNLRYRHWTMQEVTS